MNIPVAKIWNDENDIAGNRPGSIRVHLLAGGTEVNSVLLNAANNWRYTFYKLPKFTPNGTEIVYSVREDPVPGYITEYDGFNIINTYQPELVSVAVQKVWDDNDNAYGLRPLSITMRLSNGMTVVLNQANNWTAVITGLPATVNGEPVNYTWTEQEVAGYEQASVTTTGTVTVFTNSLIYTPPQDEEIPPNPGVPVYVFEEYDTPLGVAVEINHVGDCFD